MSVVLRPAILNDKRKVYTWLTATDLTPEMLGPPHFPDCPVPSWEDFDNDYLDYYFDGSRECEGRCFIIEYMGIAAGQINYNKINTEDSSTELDIWLAEKKYTGRGIGSAAIRILMKYLCEHFFCRRFYVAPSLRNSHALEFYRNAGFEIASDVPVDFIPDYYDSVLLVKVWQDF